ncbi:UNVERIFIED_CONTAM: hypothetical protein FKN15_041260 [Acipenser sinensis]
MQTELLLHPLRERELPPVQGGLEAWRLNCSLTLLSSIQTEHFIPMHREQFLMVVSELIYWKDSKRTGAVFTGLVVALISLSQLSIISVISNLAFLLMCVTLGMRLYTKILQVLNKSDGTSPFQKYLDIDISLSQKQTQHYVDRVIVMGTVAAIELRRLALVENFIDSLKVQIDKYVELVRAQLSDIRAKIQAKIPSAKPKEE